MISVVALAVLAQIPKLACCNPSMASFATDPSFLAVHGRPLPMKFQSNEGRPVTYGGADGTHTGYFVPASPGKKVAVVMVHEYWGLNDYIRREAVRLHDSTGYAVLAVDLYKGKVAQSPEEAGRLMQAVNPSEATLNVQDAVNSLYKGELGHPYSTLGTIGWCFGGGWSLQTAIHGGSKVKACVMFYGMPDDDPADLGKLRAPVLMIEALQDKWINPDVVAKFKSAAAQAHKSLHVVTYDADHAFANPSNPHYKKQDADDAMRRSIAFLKSNLG